MLHLGHNRNARKGIASFLLLVLGVSTALGMTFGRPAPVYAIPVEVTADAPFTAFFVRNETNLGLAESAAVAVVGAANYFLSQIAYSAAVALTSDCPGQVVCWNTKAFKDGFTQAWQGAIGEAVGELSEALGLGDLLCSPKALNFALQLSLLNELKPLPPKCDFNALVSNWDSAISSLTNAELSDVIKLQFQPGQSELSAGLIMYDHIHNDVKRDAEINSIVGKLAAAANGGFGAITDMVTGRVTAPEDTVRQQFQTNALVEEKKLDSSNAVTAGQIAKGAVIGVALNVTSVFVQTLAARLLQKLADGLISGDEAREAQPDLVLSAEGILLPPGKSGAERIAARRGSATLIPREIADIDPLIDFTTCPAQNPTQHNCVMDTQFANAVRAAAFEPLTVEDALLKGFLHGDWPLVSSLHDRAAANDRNCYARGYCEPNLRILRAFRIIPVGWEIAAFDVWGDAQHPPTLQQAVDGFNDCSVTGQRDEQHKFCKLINPDWVLKVPATRCLQEGYSDTLIDPNLSTRVTQCTDVVQCLGEDGQGQCEDGYGYCMYEKNIWRFRGDECPAYFNTCTTVTPTSGTSRSYLTNTIASGICDADNAGCKQYSVYPNPFDGPAKADDWWTGFGSLTDRYYTRKVETCSPSDDGCTAIRELSPGESLNLVKNGGFDELEDNDLDGASESPRYWDQPAGFIAATHTGHLSTDGSHSSSGLAAAFLAAEPGGFSICSLGSVCTDPSGCGCPAAATRPANASTCKVGMNLSSCLFVNAVTQGDIPIYANRTYTMSARFNPDLTTGSYTARVRLRFYDEKGAQIPLTANTFVTSASSDNIAAATSTTCSVLSESAYFNIPNYPASQRQYLELTLAGSAPGGAVTPTCTFSAPQPAAWVTPGLPVHATIELVSTSGTGVWVDDVMVEEGFGTPFHEGDNGSGSIDYVKVPPNHLGCRGEATDPEDCKNYAQACLETEVGCAAYTPTNGDPMVPGIIAEEDRCPAECVGYDTFKQERSNFDVEKFPLYFIPTTAQSCTAADAGCTEFTNLKDESRAYFTQIRVCQLPGSADTDRYYTWEGSDAAGYQIQVWNLKRSNVTSTHSATGSDLSGVTGAANGAPAGQAPCTKLSVNSTNTCTNALTDGLDEGVCTLADIQGGSIDCREFYDGEANRHFRLLSKTVQESAACQDHRITEVSSSDCQLSNGRWNSATNTCVFAIDPGLSRSCSAAAKGCRSYSGNAAGNVQTMFSEDFESGFNFDKFADGEGWANRSLTSSSLLYSSEALTVGGHVLKVQRHLSGGAYRRVALRDVSKHMELGRSYMVRFWARGTGNIEVRFDSATVGGVISPPVKQFAYAADDAATPEREPVITLDTQWREYSLGPVIFGAATLPPQVLLRFGDAADAPTTTPDFYLDNVRFERVEDAIYVVRDSWVTPLSCDSTASGIPSPREMLGCRAYETEDGATVTLRSFDQLCRETAIGCQAYTDLQDTPTDPYEHSYNNICSVDNPETAAIETCTPGAGSVGCPCQIDLFLLGFTSGPYDAGNGEFRKIENVCTIAPGASSCRFETDRRLAVSGRPQGSGWYWGATVEATCRLASACTSATPGAAPDANGKWFCGCSEPTYGFCLVPEGSTWCSAKNDTVVVNADERRYLVVKDSNRCSATAASCTATGVAKKGQEGTCRFTEFGGALGPAGDTPDPTDDYQFSCGAKICTSGENKGSVCAANGDCGTGGVCANSPFPPTNGQCYCADIPPYVGFLGSCFIKEGEDSCVYQNVSGPTVQEWTAGAVKDDPSKYATTLCTSEAVSCEEWKTKDRTLYFKDPGDHVCEYKENIDYRFPGSLVTVKRSGWFRKTSDGSLFPCAPELVKNGNEFGIYRNDDISCTLQAVCSDLAGCLCYPVKPTNATCDGGASDPSTCGVYPSCRVAPDQRSCGFQEWIGSCESKYSACTEFVDPFDTSNNAPDGKPYYFLDNAKLDRGACTGGASLENGCVVFDQTVNTEKSMNARATYALSQRKYDGSNVAPVNCEDNPGHEFCQNLCSWIDNGQCSGNGQPCSINGNCPSGQTCQGQRVVGDACRDSNDCGGLECLPPTGVLAGFEKDIKANDGNVVLKVVRDRECAAWLEKSQCSSVKDPNSGEYVSQCSGLVACYEHEPTSSGFECTEDYNSLAFPFVDAWYTLRSTSWNSVDFDGYTVMGRVFPDIVDAVNVAPGWCQDANGVVFSPIWSCYADSDCTPNFGASATCSQSRQGVCSELYQGKWMLGCDTSANCGAGFCDTSDAGKIRAGVRYSLPLGRTCAAHTDCGSAACIHGQCWWNIYGGFFDVTTGTNKIQCREYPEKDAPFKDTVFADVVPSLDPNNFTPASKKNDFKEANTCFPGQACQCAYNRLDYGSSTKSLFLSATSNLSAPPTLLAICSGGTLDGWSCANDPNLCGEGGACTLVSNITHAIGHQGFCFDPDYSSSINGDPNEFGCTLWLPVDHLNGTADIYNQHPEAGYQSPGGRQNLLYCTEAEGNSVVNGFYNGYEPLIWYETSDTDMDTRLWGGGTGDAEYRDETRSFPLSAPIDAASVVAIAVEFQGDGNIDDAGARTTLWLDAGNSFFQGMDVDIGDDGDNTSTLSGRGSQVYTLSNSGWGRCDGVGDGDSDCEAGTENKNDCVSAQAIFSGGNLTGLRTRLCHDTIGDRDLYPIATVKAYLREQCSEFLHAYADGTTIVATDTIWRLQNQPGFLVGLYPPYAYKHDTTDQVGVDRTLEPFGGMSYTGAVNNVMGVALGSKIPVAPEDLGSPYTTSGGAALPTFVVPSSNGLKVVAGYPFACAGPCVSGVSNSNRGAGTASDAGRSLFQRVFISGIGGDYVWDGSKYALQADTGWDFREGYTGEDHKVKVHALDPERCTTSDCEEVNRDGITVNDEYLPGSKVCGDGGSLDARIRYYAFAHPDHMPIKWKVFDFGFGDPRYDVKIGDFRNHRGINPATQVSWCDGSSWGQTAEACESAWYEEQITYRCEQAFMDTLPQCDGSTYPCRGTDQSRPACFFKPRVQFLDNWRVCNGTCPLAPGAGTVCIFDECNPNALTYGNNYTGVDANGSGSGPNKPWTEFAGDIVVFPSPPPGGTSNGCGGP